MDNVYLRIREVTNLRIRWFADLRILNPNYGDKDGDRESDHAYAP